jgi:LCP family protein required for cell wall assembly
MLAQNIKTDMNFKPRKINKKPKAKTVLEVSKNSSKNRIPQFNFALANKLFHNKVVLLILLVLFCITGALAVYKFTPAKTIVTKTILKTIGSDLKKDKDGYTNVLAVGIGGKGHSGSDLTDTLIVASINEKLNKVVLSSIPRDLYVKHENIIAQRINSVYENTKYRLGEEEGMQTLSDIASDFVGFPIHYYIKIDFKGLVDVVDAVGGIEVYNEETIYDPFYPGPNYSYQTFSLPQGTQYLDGETALKFARSRKTSSDFARSNRQQQVIFGIKEKALQLNILSSPERLTDLYKSIESNIGTNLTIREITSLAAVASDLQSTDLVSAIVNDDFNNKGGFLYTPPRSQYADAFVLLPADKSLSQIHTFYKLHRLFPTLMKNPIPFDVLNGTKTPGLAGSTAATLQRYGFEINEIKNIENRDIEVTTSFIQTSIGKDADLVKAIKELFKPIEQTQAIDPVMPDPTEDGLPASVKIVAGTDLISTLKYYDVYSSLAPIIEQAIAENRAAQGTPDATEAILPELPDINAPEPVLNQNTDEVTNAPTTLPSSDLTPIQ